MNIFIKSYKLMEIQLQKNLSENQNLNYELNEITEKLCENKKKLEKFEILNIEFKNKCDLFMKDNEFLNKRYNINI